jgi:hypothetical protein
MSKAEGERTPTVILTQFGPTSVIPDLLRGETRDRSMACKNGYTKRHGDHTSNPLPTDKEDSRG